MKLTLTIGNKNYSSWSMRPFVLMREVGIEFDVRQICLQEDRDRSLRRSLSGMGTVPVLQVSTDREEFLVPDTLAITETLNELFPETRIWPEDPVVRARARALCAEMHAGFHALRSEMPMNCRRRAARREPGSEALARDIGRVQEIFESAVGPLLCGRFCAADAFFAPVASRLRSYEEPLSVSASTMVDALLDLPSVREWTEAGASEERRFESYDSL